MLFDVVTCGAEAADDVPHLQVAAALAMTNAVAAGQRRHHGVVPVGLALVALLGLALPEVDDAYRVALEDRGAVGLALCGVHVARGRTVHPAAGNRDARLV